MTKPKTVIGVDIGSSCIKVVELKEVRNEIFLKRAGFINIPVDFSLTPPQKSQLAAKKLTKLLAALNLKGASVITSMSGQSVLIRLLKLPPVPEEKLEQVIKYEAQQKVPFSLDEVLWDYHLLKREKVLEIQVLLVAVKIDLIEEIQKKLEPHHLADIIDVSPLALYNCVSANRTPKDNEKGTVIIDIGAESTDVIIFKKENVWTRSFPIGGNNFSQALQKEFGLSFLEAERIKKGGLKGYPQEEANRVMKPVLGDLTVEIQHAIGYYRGRVEGLTLDEVILTGGSSRLPDLDKFFSNNLGMEVKYFNPFKLIKTEPDGKVFAEDKWETLESHRHIFGTAAGLALRGRVKCGIEINFLSQELQKKKRRYKKKEIFAFITIIFFALLGAGMFSLYRGSLNLQKELKEIQEVYNSEYEVNRPRIESLRQDLSLLKDKSGVVYKLLSEKMLGVELIRDTGKSLSPSVWIETFSFPAASQRAEEKTKQFLFLKGKAVSYEAINEFMEKLKRFSSYIKRVEPLVSSSTAVDEKELFEFSLEAELAMDK